MSTNASTDQERDLLRRLFDAMPQLGWTAQPDGFVDHYNRGWYEYTGTTYEQMRGWGWTSVHHPEEIERVLESWKRSIALGLPWEIEFPLRRHDGVFRWFLSRATPILDDNGALLRWVGINTDIDDQKRAEREVAELARAKTTFFHNVSHELRTPLTLILAPLEDAMATPGGALEGKALEMARRNAMRLLKLVNTVLDFARIEDGRDDAEFTPTDIGKLTRDLASSFESVATSAGLQLSVDVEPPGPAVYVDHTMWEKLVLNLLSNALKFTLAGSISVSLVYRGDDAVLSVSDTGVGIPAHETPKVFDRFHRVAGANGRSHEGTGIGLSLVQEVVRMHGGRVSLTSVVGEGTTVEIKIPVGSAHLPTGKVRHSASHARSERKAYVEEAEQWLAKRATQPPEQTRATDELVLVADDNADMRAYLENLLAAHWRVKLVRDGVEALESSRRERPHVLVTDAMMPNLDGFALLDALRADAELRTVPVLMLSAQAGESARIEGLERGADDYLVKPFSARELVARIRSLLQAKALRERAEADRENFRQLFLQSPVPVALFRGPDNRFVEVSPSYAAMIPSREPIGSPIRDVYPELAHDHPMFEALKRAKSCAEPVRIDEMHFPAGTLAVGECWFDFVARGLRGASEATTDTTMVIAFDVTSRVASRIAVEDARRKAEHLQTLLATAQRVARIGVYDWDIVAKTLFWSPELYMLMGLAVGEIEPSPDAWTARVHPEDARAGWAEFGRACEARRSTNETEQRIVCADGTTRWMRITNYIMYGPDGTASRVIGTMIDIEDLRQLADRERAARHDAEQASRTKDEFIAMLGHELRNPLAPIVTAAALIRSRCGPVVGREVDVIERQSRHLVRLVEDLLDVSRIARGKIDLSFETLEIAAVLSAAIETVSPLMENGRHTLAVNAPETGLLVRGDRTRLAQVFVNLLANAAKYTPSGGRIEVTARRSNDDVEVVVVDDGIGIDAELLTRVFDLFVQARQTIERSLGGLGLGLSIVRSLISLHGGSVHAASDGPGKGSRFAVLLPAEEGRSSPTLPPPQLPAPPHTKSGQRIMVVDDNEDAAEMLALILRTHGHDVAVAHDGPDALALANRFAPHVALLDIGLPVMDGYELAAELRKSRGRDLRLIAITGYGQSSDRERALAAGFQDHMVKPVDLEKLASLLGTDVPT